MPLTPDSLKPFLSTTLDSTDFKGLGEKYTGKVRDVYSQKDRSILIATDRQSAFDISWCTIPLKGQALNQISAWWFEQVKDIMPTHVLAVPDENAMVVTKLDMLKVEIVVRGYLTGSTGTSAWVNYAKGVRNFCGNQLPEGMLKNQKFKSPIITPTTKGETDELIDAKGIIERKLATAKQWDEISEKALVVFKRGQEIAAKRGLILVDTKYEMGVDKEGRIVMADEVHTPDSSRYWVQKSYEDRMAKGQEPESLDKEFFRLWLKEKGFDPSTRFVYPEQNRRARSGQARPSTRFVYPEQNRRARSGQARPSTRFVYPEQNRRARSGQARPEITDDVRTMLALKYIQLHEKITGNAFVLPKSPDVKGRIEKNLKPYAL